MPCPSGEFADEIPADQPSAPAARRISRHVDAELLDPEPRDSGPPHDSERSGYEPAAFDCQAATRAAGEPGRGDRRLRARELAEAATALLATSPAAAERMLLQALDCGSGVLSGEQLARLSSLVVTAVAHQPGREHDLAAAAVAAAESWAGISAADAAHHTLLAARVHYRSGHHRLAATLFAAALGCDALPYPPEEVAVLYEQLGRCLEQSHRHRGAARAYAAGAAAVAGRPQWRELHGDLIEAATRSRRSARNPAAMVRAYLSARRTP
ncbi:hypothetical protein J2W56_002215 [Nocardia kruczakiae]|uniref:Tetratricopeptide repeat protein n=1 Tax=Nocardia kruczakiae TaxID=261477 RepID=A0ABU1XDR5_9NOCA|nr:hypothetical protein [Nocardia kruczakiae]MDR7168484.1 hypothetical protein [Nocardia kruczakiae]